MNNPTCTVPDCEKQARSRVAAYCPMHYHRLYRHGDLNATFTNIRTGTPRLYRTMPAKGHPTAMRNQRAYVHRKVLYDTIGGGVHPCYWCGQEVTWFAGFGKPGNLVVDHLNGDKSDNRPTNLAPACVRCNGGRAQQERHRIIKEELGGWSVNDTIATLRQEQMRRCAPIVADGGGSAA